MGDVACMCLYGEETLSMSPPLFMFGNLRKRNEEDGDKTKKRIRPTSMHDKRSQHNLDENGQIKKKLAL